MSAKADHETATTTGLSLHVDGLDAGYGGPPVLRDLDLAVPAGQVVALLGSNGAGKSTLARAITGFAATTAGTVRVGDHTLTRRPAHEITRLGVAHVPEGRRLFGSLSVEQNLWLPNHWQDEPTDQYRDRLDQVFDRFPRLRDRSSQRAGSLSGGEQQMLAIARALMLRPRLLILDEPSTGLAPLLVAEIFSIVRDLRQELHVTMLLIEQNAAQALQVADRGLVMQRGRIVVDQPALELRDDPQVRTMYLGR